MSPVLQADALVTAIDHAESRSAAVGRAVAGAAEDLDAVARELGSYSIVASPFGVDPVAPTLGADPAGGWAGRAGSAGGWAGRANPAGGGAGRAGSAGGWAGRAGDRARVRVADAAAESRMLAGACLFLSDVLRVEGARLARAVVNWADDDTVVVGSGDNTAVVDADRALAMRLREAADSLAGVADPDTRPCLDLSSTTGDDPRAVAALWHSLGPAERERLARDHPDLGSVAGLSSSTRDAINRTRLRRLLEAPVLGRAGGGSAGGAGGGSGGGAGGGSTGWTAGRGAAGPGLAALAAYLEEDPRRHLLSLHTDGRAVVASGDPDAAGRVVTLVPGTGSSLESLGRTGERADAMCEAATSGTSASPAATSGTSTGLAATSGTPAGPAGLTGPVDAGAETCVSVAWQGYDAPDNIAEAGRSTAPARAHAEDLRTYAAGVDAVEAMDGDDAPHTVVGYSYGSATLGAAASDPQGLAADRMIHVGSPGAVVDSIEDQWVDRGGNSRRAEQDEVVGVASRWDPVPWWSISGVLGERPGSGAFGGIEVDATEPDLAPSSARTAFLARITESHSRYFDAGTVSLEEIGRLIADSD